ncbi:hypothetical protein MEQU1_002244 [Malassezia equina]|uniref:Uncharacterized protein n=1 Tax=Malassezia equina TaxID=1381935 RepID=A0AAF0EIU6_9BASI|nr:hypothetical protein MEQU1_002244 [Malassezia equina]
MVNASNDGSSLSGGAIAGIAIGAFVGLALIALLAYLLSRWKPSGRTEQGMATTPTLAAEPPSRQAPATEPPVTEPTTYAAQDATYMSPAPALSPTYYTTDTLAPYLEQEPHTAYMAQEEPSSWQTPYNPIASRAPATDAALASTDAAAWPEDQSTYDQNTFASAPPPPQHIYRSPTSLESTDKLDARSRRNAAAEAADAALKYGTAYHPTSDWDDSASELPYIRTSRRRGAVDA